MEYTSVSLTAPRKDQWLEAVRDLHQGLLQYRLWGQLGIQSIQTSYRRTFLGPIWLTASSLVGILAFAVMRQVVNPDAEFREAISHVGVGYVLLNFATNNFSRSASSLLQHNLSGTHENLLSLAIFHHFWADVLEFLHELLPILLLITALGYISGPSWTEFVVAMMSCIVFAFGFRLWLGVLGARFRDLAPVIQIFNRFQFLLCPVFWSYGDVSADSTIRTLSLFIPTSYFIESVRKSLFDFEDSGLFGSSVTVITAAIALLNLCLGIAIFVMFRKRASFWKLAS